MSDWHLSSACSNSGILRTLGLWSMGHEEIELNIGKMNEHTKNPFAVNIPLLRPDAADIVRISHAAGVSIFITSAGNASCGRYRGQ